MFLAVSMKLSPFERLEPPVVKSMVSALNRLAASPKLVRVRVDGSKNRLTTTLPLSWVSFPRRLWLTSINSSALSKIVSNSVRLKLSSSSRFRRVQEVVFGSGTASSRLTMASLVAASLLLAGVWWAS